MTASILWRDYDIQLSADYNIVVEPKRNMHSYLIPTTITDSTNWKKFGIAILRYPAIDFHPGHPTLLTALKNAKLRLVNLPSSNAILQWSSIALDMRGNESPLNEPKRPAFLSSSPGGSIRRFNIWNNNSTEEAKALSIHEDLALLSRET